MFAALYCFFAATPHSAMFPQLLAVRQSCLGNLFDLRYRFQELIVIDFPASDFLIIDQNHRHAIAKFHGQVRIGIDIFHLELRILVQN